MRLFLIGSVALATLFGPLPLAAQGTQVRTYNLNRLSPTEAADLLTPYVDRAVGGVFSAGTGVRGVTVHGTRETLATVDSILRVNDQPAGTVRLRFRLIAAVDSAGPVDPAIADVDAALRGLFSYKGYRFLGEGAVIAKEGFEGFSLTINVSSMERYIVSGAVRQLDLDAPTPTAQMRLTLRGPLAEAGSYSLTTEVPAALGKTVVVGSSGRIQASGTMILAVRPERN